MAESRFAIEVHNNVAFLECKYHTIPRDFLRLLCPSELQLLIVTTVCLHRAIVIRLKAEVDKEFLCLNQRLDVL